MPADSDRPCEVCDGYEAWGLEEGEHHVRDLKQDTFRRVIAAARGF